MCRVLQGSGDVQSLRDFVRTGEDLGKHKQNSVQTNTTWAWQWRQIYYRLGTFPHQWEYTLNLTKYIGRRLYQQRKYKEILNYHT